MKYSDDVAKLALAMIRHGLKQEDPSRLIREEKLHALDSARRLINAGHDYQELLDAARYGMSNVWPFNDGQAWDPQDFKRNISKAKAEARRLRQTGNVPTKASEL